MDNEPALFVSHGKASAVSATAMGKDTHVETKVLPHIRRGEMLGYAIWQNGQIMTEEEVKRYV